MKRAMSREQRLEAMAAADATSIVSLADRVLEDFEVEVTRGPTVGLLMVRVEEPAERLPFNFAEVTVAEAEVSAGEHRGYAMVMGKSMEQALAAAILDAAMAAEHPLTATIETFLDAATEFADERWAERWSDVAATRVQFEDVT